MKQLHFDKISGRLIEHLNAMQLHFDKFSGRLIEREAIEQAKQLNI